MASFDKADLMTSEVDSAIVDSLEISRTLDTRKKDMDDAVRRVLVAAVRGIVKNVPPSSDRMAAIRAIRSARMWCYSAITHEGKY